MISRYMKERQALKLKAKPTAKEEKEGKQEKIGWYGRKINEANRQKCENCNKSLRPSMVINPATVVAHILPKRKDGGCPSVAFHDNNYMLLCEACHGAYDKASSEEIEQMPVYLIAYHRVQTFLHLIPANELRNVAACFTNKLPELFL